MKAVGGATGDLETPPPLRKSGQVDLPALIAVDAVAPAAAVLFVWKGRSWCTMDEHFEGV